MKDRDWRRLLEQMKEGTVVPVIGPRLLLDADGTSSLTDRIARRLLADYDVDIGDQSLPPFRELNDVATRLKGRLRNPQDLYGDVDSALKSLGMLEDEGRPKGVGAEVAIPTPLQQLAQITDFRLMVSLTPDDMLAQALKRARRAVHEVVHSPRLPTSEVGDLQVVDRAELRRPGGAVELLYLFGKSRPTPLFAIHDEDLLEYAHNLIANGSHAPAKFMGALQECSLLLIGCNFPDWLSRFILRATRKVRLADSGGRREWLVERLGQEDPFVGFLGQYSPETEVMTSVEPAEFVAELYQRWTAQRSPEAGPAETPALEPEAARDNTLFFISYSRSTDQDAARALHQALVSIGVAANQIWFDTQTLEPGDKYTRGILEGIRSCRYFLPLVSRAATERERAFVFREWSEATDQELEMNRTYLVPLVVDAEYRPESYSEESVATWLERKIDFGHAPGGQPDERTRRTLTSLLREARSRG